MEEKVRVAFNIREAAAAAGLSVPIMTGLVHSENFPALRVGRRWVIPCDAFKQWLDEQARNRRVVGA